MERLSSEVDVSIDIANVIGCSGGADIGWRQAEMGRKEAKMGMRED